MNAPIRVNSIITRRWFEKTNGNMYHTVELVLDNGTTRKSPRAYGYGDMWRQTARNLLGTESGLVYHIEVWNEATVLDVPRKKDL